MNKVVKGSFCAICDIEEHSRFSNKDKYVKPVTGDTEVPLSQRMLQSDDGNTVKNLPTNVYLSPADAFAFSDKCVDYIEEHYELLQHLKAFRTVLKKKINNSQIKKIVFPAIESRHKLAQTI